MACYDVDFVTFNFSRELEGGLSGIHSRTQGFGHVLNVVFVQVKRVFPARVHETGGGLGV